MSPAGDGALRALAFGTLDGSLWAAAIDHGAPALVLGGGASAAGLPIAQWTGDGEGRWTLTGDGFELNVHPAPAIEPDVAVAGAAPSGPDALAQLCRVRGTVTLGGDAREVDCVGTRIAVAPAGAVASARLVAGWFADAEALELLALRGGPDAHHDADAVAATLFDPDGWIPVADPRLSTTYDGTGAPARANLELWIGDGENEFPRRAAGELAGPGGGVQLDGLALHVAPLSCHSRGQEGAGVYALATF